MPDRKDAERSEPKEKGSFYSHHLGRIRAAYANTRGREEPGTLGDFQERFILAGVEALERKYNGGEPWPDVTAGEVKSLTQMGVGRNAK